MFCDELTELPVKTKKPYVLLCRTGLIVWRSSARSDQNIRCIVWHMMIVYSIIVASR
jgi:hypothetical protein